MSTTENHSQEGTKGTWRSLVIAKLAKVETALQHVDTTLKDRLAKSRAQFEEVNRLTESAIQWADELQQGVVDLARSALKSVQDAVQKV